MTLGDHISQSESLKSTNTPAYAEHKSIPVDKYDEQNGSERAIGQDEDNLTKCMTPLEKQPEHEYLIDQGSESSLKDRYGKPKQHGTLWEPPIVYVNTELSGQKSSPNIKSLESAVLDHRFHESQPPSSPKGQKISCSCCHPDQVHFRHQTEISRHHGGPSSHPISYDRDHHHEVFYLPIETDERSSHYQLPHSCNCSSCQKGRIEALPTHAGHVSKDTRRDVIPSDSLRLLLPQPGSRPVSEFQFFMWISQFSF